ncbi:MAG: hypothetical protein KI786_18275 [Mameliella sp.]|nr:hypothetical protein [Phaeodactylibacter sp.]NRA48377.1 hypothetical protein [Phaeodactylibacter sp.]
MMPYQPNNRNPIPPSAWQDWTVACASGEFLGITAAAAIAFGHRMLLGEPQTGSDGLLNLFFMLIAGVLEGGILAYFQYRLIGKFIPEIAWKQWLAYTVVAAVIGWMLGMLPSLFLSGNDATATMQEPEPIIYYSLAGLMGLLLGALFGYFQWLPLKGLRKEAILWIPANAIGWAVGMVFIFIGASWPDEMTPWYLILLAGAVGGISAGLSVGAITGFFLLRILQSGPKQR